VLPCACALLFSTAAAGPPSPAAPGRVRVESSVIASIGYDEKTRALDIEFRTGATWRYLDVPPEIYHALLAAESKGRFYNANLKHRFRAKKLEPAENVVPSPEAQPQS
jgi:hypothetical protein